MHLLVHALISSRPVFDFDRLPKPSFADRTDIILDGTVNLETHCLLLIGEHGFIEGLLHDFEPCRQFVVLGAEMLNTLAKDLVGFSSS